MAGELQKVGMSVSIDAELERLEANFKRAGRLVDTTSTNMDRSTKRAAKAFNQLEASMDPVARAGQNLERQSDKVRIAQEKGIITAEQAGAAYRRLNDRFDAYVAKLKQAGVAVAANDNAVVKAAPNYRRFGAIAQQAGYQVGDFAVQVASGQNVLVALTQQASQLLGAFGPWGAVIGAAAAIAGALAIAFWDTSESADEAATSLEAYEKSVKKAEEFIKKLNDQQKESAELLRDERDEILKTAKARLEAAKAALEIRKAEIERINAMSNDPMFGIGDEPIDAGVYQNQINEIAELQAKFDDLNDSMTAAIDSSEEFKASQEADKSRKKAADDAERQAEKIGAVIEALQYELSAFELTNRELEVNNALRRAGVDGASAQGILIRQLAGDVYDYKQRLDDLNDALDREAKVMEEGARVTEANRTAQEKYNDEIERLRELLAEGAISQETYGRAASAAADDLTKANEKLNKTGKEVGRVLGNAFSDLGGWADDARGKVDQLAMSIAEMVWQQQIAQPAADAIGGAIGGIDWGSMFAFADGGVMTSRGKLPLRQYSEGGIANSPQLAMFGEGSVPEAYVPVPSGKIPVDIRMPKMPAANSGGPSAIFNIDARGADQAGMARLETAITAIGGEVRRIDSTFNKRAVNAVSDQARRGGSAGRAIRGR